MRKINNIGEKSSLTKLRYGLLIIVSSNSATLIQKLGL